LEVASEALHREYGLDRLGLTEHVGVLLNHRFPNRELADTVARVARQPLRKIGPGERLVGLLRLVQRHRLDITPICRVMGAALHYFDPQDSECVSMKAMVEQGGPGRVLEEICGINSQDPAYRMSLDFYSSHSIFPGRHNYG
jgi:mannitol-1-phosphate 5-dehydrogenase